MAGDSRAAGSLPAAGEGQPRALTDSPAEGDLLGGVGDLIHPAVGDGCAMAWRIARNHIGSGGAGRWRHQAPLVVAPGHVGVPPGEVGPGAVQFEAHPVGLVVHRDKEALQGAEGSSDSAQRAWQQGHWV